MGTVSHHGVPKDYKHLVRAAADGGWKVVHKTRHVQLWAPNGHDRVTIPGTPSDRRSYRNVRAALRRAGVAV